MSIFTKVIGLKEEVLNPSNLDYSQLMKEGEPSVIPSEEDDRGVVQDIWEHFDYKYMQPIFLKELIPHREFQIIKEQQQQLNPFGEQEEDNKEDEE